MSFLRKKGSVYILIVFTCRPGIPSQTRTWDAFAVTIEIDQVHKKWQPLG